jgi:aryl-alcohol dehydrogenase-like predicted oxidoreductase
MEQRPLGRTGADVSVIGLGTWQLGGDWGDVDDDAAADVLDAALDAGVTLLDTADVYGDGRSEERIRTALAPRSDRPFVATKAGRRADPFEAEQYTPENLRAWIDRSRRNLGVETLDLVQLHCPPPAVYSDQRVYDTLDALVAEEAIAAYGVSVETVGEGLTALQHPGVQTIQVILNIFRRKPLEELLPAARKADVGILARVPLASGLLTGKYKRDAPPPKGTRLATTQRLADRYMTEANWRKVEGLEDFAKRHGRSLLELAFSWLAAKPYVSSVIAGATKPEQLEANVRAVEWALTAEDTAEIDRLTFGS